MIDKSDDEKLKKRIELFESYHNDPDQHHKLFTELGFSYMVDECDGNCTDCKEKTTCEIFAKIKENEEDIG
jgi:hypothetical protein